MEYFYGLQNAIMPTKEYVTYFVTWSAHDLETDADVHAPSLFLYIGSVIADSLICWRLYVIWSQRKRILVAPLILLVLGTASGAMVVAYEYKTLSIYDDRFRPMINLWTIMAFGSTMMVNLVVTILIAGRLWCVFRRDPFG